MFIFILIYTLFIQVLEYKIKNLNQSKQKNIKMLSIRNFTKQLSLISQIQSASFKISGKIVETSLK